MNNFCCSVILGHDLLRQHYHVEIIFGKLKPSLKLCGLTTANMTYPALFANLMPNSKSIAIKSRRHINEEKHSINNEFKSMLREGIIEPSHSLWNVFRKPQKEND